MIYSKFNKFLSKLGITDYWKWKLEDDFVYDDEDFIGIEIYTPWGCIVDGELTIFAGYAWNGCSPKKKFLDLFSFGTPDGVLDLNTSKQKSYYASLIHDILYQYEMIDKKLADSIFYEELKIDEFAPAKLYYWAVKIFGKRW